MKPLQLAILPQLNQSFKRHLPCAVRQAGLAQACPRQYPYRIWPQGLLQAVMLALLLRLSGLRALAARGSRLLGTGNYSSISHALARPHFVAYERALLEHLERRFTPAAEELVAVDSMSATLAATRRHHCASFHHDTVGGGILWAWRLGACAGACPLKVLGLMRGAWHDTTLARTVPWQAQGPVYLLDRGFYALDLLARWLAQQVRFIVRVRQRSLCYEVLEPLSPPRRVGDKQLKLDARVRLGAAKAKHRPVVRLLLVTRASGEDLLLATERWDWSAERLLAAYKQRWQIERLHKFLKDTLGLAHLYSFDQNGLEFELLAAALLVELMVLSQRAAHGCNVRLLYRVLRLWRRLLGLDTPWRRNLGAHAKRTKGRRRRKPATAQPAAPPPAQNL